MTRGAPPAPAIREAVASFPDREHFHNAVRALLAAGFDPSDLSVLASHRSLRAAEEKRGDLIAAGLTDDVKYIWPLTTFGVVLVSGEPIAAIFAALLGAGLGGAALKEFFDDYMAAPHREDFEAALSAGAALLWVRCADPTRQSQALRILEESGGRHAHLHARPAPEQG